MTAILLVLFILQVPCADCGPSTSSPEARSQFEGLSNAVSSLEKQVATLAEEKRVSPWTRQSIDADLSVAVTNISDSLADNPLLARAYLALAVAELKLIQSAESRVQMTQELRMRTLRHIEAVQLSIDDRTFDRDDVRVFRVLTAGVRQELRKELEELAKPRPTGDATGYPVLSGPESCLLPDQRYTFQSSCNDQAPSLRQYRRIWNCRFFVKR